MTKWTALVLVPLMGCVDPQVGDPCTVDDDCGTVLFCATPEAAEDSAEGSCEAAKEADPREAAKRSQMYDML